MIDQQICPEARLALLIAKWVVSDQGFKEIEELLQHKKIKWQQFNGLSDYHELSAFAYICLRKLSRLLPKEETELLQKHYIFTLSRSLYLWREFEFVGRAFREKEIIFLPLKGIAFFLENLYSDKTYLRPMADIDILIKKEELPLAERIMENLGYEKKMRGMKKDYWLNRSYHLGFIKNFNEGLPYIAELHWALDFKRGKPMLTSLWQRTKKYEFDGKDIYSLSPEDNLLSLALHQRHFGKALCLKYTCDTELILSRYNGKLDWDYIIKEADTSEIRTALYFMLIQTELFFDHKIPSFVLRALNVVSYKDRLIKQFILRNTFLAASSASQERLEINMLFLKSHFLLYDNFWEPIRFILNVPQEQFAQFYGLPPYTFKSNLLYRLRYLYFLTKMTSERITDFIL